jgi:FkbM family methyltransferase
MPDSLVEALRRDGADTGHMRRLLAFALTTDANCIDVGAHRGSILREMLRVAPAGHHIAFEPLPNLAALLTDAFPEVEVHQAALSNHTGHTTFEHVHGVAEGCSGFLMCTAPTGYANEVEEITVRLETLDGSLDPDYQPQLIKIDVEGAELQVLQGALETLSRHQPIVVFEHAFAACNAYGTEPADVYRLLREAAGLRIFDLDGSGPYELGQFERSSRVGERVNYVARV